MKNTIALIALITLSSFQFKQKPLMIQDYKLVKVERNTAGQIVKVKYEKVGKPYLMPDSALEKTIHTIIE